MAGWKERIHLLVEMLFWATVQFNSFVPFLSFNVMPPKISSVFL